MTGRRGRLELREASAADADTLAAVYRSAYAENRELGFPAKAASATADEVREWIRDSRVLVVVADGDDVVDADVVADRDAVVDADDVADRDAVADADDVADRDAVANADDVADRDAVANADDVAVADVADDVVGGGNVVAGVRLEGTAPDRIKLSRLAVRDDLQGQGIGGRLLCVPSGLPAMRGTGRSDSRRPRRTLTCPTSTATAGTR